MKVKDNKDPNTETPTERVTKKILQALLEGLGLEKIDLTAHFALTKKVMLGNPRNQRKTTVIFGAFSLTKLNGKGHPIAFSIADWLMLEEKLYKTTSRVDMYRKLAGMPGVINYTIITIPLNNRPSECLIIILGERGHHLS